MSLQRPWAPMRSSRRVAVVAAAACVAVLPLTSGADVFAAAGDVRAVTREAAGAAARPTVSDSGTAFFSTEVAMVTKDRNRLADVYQSTPTGALRLWSEGWRGAVSDGESGPIDASADGTVVTFVSTSTTLWGADNNKLRDVYVCRASPNTCQTAGWVAWGREPNGPSWVPRISADGKWVVFASDASNWVPGDTNGVRDVFVASLTNGQVTRVSVAADGSQLRSPSNHPQISSDGSLVTFTTKAAAVKRDRNGVPDVYLRDLTAERTELMSVARSGALANKASFRSAVAKRCVNGTCRPTVAFVSAATNLVPRDTNNARDIFIREGTSTGRASVSSAGRQGKAKEASWWPSLSSDGRLVAFTTHADLTGRASKVPQVMVRDRVTGKVTMHSALAGRPGNRVSDQPSLSPNGRYLAFKSKASNLDTLSADNRTWDIFVAQLS
jgi:hypothetical protein